MTLTASIHEHIDWKEASNHMRDGEDYIIFADIDKENWHGQKYLWYFNEGTGRDCITKASLPWYEHLELTWMLGG